MSKSPVERALDELLVLTCRAGGHAAFLTLYERWQSKLLAHAALLLGRRNAVGMIKLMIFSHVERQMILREVKRVELQVATLSLRLVDKSS